jgi:hypothetical protein
MLRTKKGDPLVVKGTLINLALEKRNAQLICGADGKGLDEILNLAFSDKDYMLMKLVRNLASHDAAIQNNFVVG